MPPITVFCAFTRTWALQIWLDCLEKQNYPKELINLCFIVDGEQELTAVRLREFARQNKYRSCRVVENPDHFVNDVRISARRLRIADIKEESKNLIARTDGEYVIGLEDDTVFPEDTFTILVNNILYNPNTGFIEGVQCGRWGVKMIGAWSVTPDKAETLLPPPNEVGRTITAGGFYGYITPKHLYLEHEYYWDKSQPWGPDVNYGIWLNEKGYDCYINWELVFGHNDHNKILWPDEDLAQVVYTLDKTTNRWKRTDYGQSSKI